MSESRPTPHPAVFSVSPLTLTFFQAEDGIRDVAVTGVQTCALPICWGCEPAVAYPGPFTGLSPGQAGRSRPRSGERRVGKECRSRWAPDHLQKKKHTSAPSGFVEPRRRRRHLLARVSQVV